MIWGTSLSKLIGPGFGCQSQLILNTYFCKNCLKSMKEIYALSS